MPSNHHGCREVAQLISQSQDTRLGLPERLRVQWHLWQCRGCRQFARQTRFLQEASRRWRSDADKD